MIKNPLITEKLDQKYRLTQLSTVLSAAIELAEKVNLAAQLVSLIRYKEFVVEEIGTVHEEYLALVEQHHSQPEFNAEAAGVGGETWYLNKVTFSVGQGKPVSQIIAQGRRENMKDICVAMVQFYSTTKEA